MDRGASHGSVLMPILSFSEDEIDEDVFAVVNPAGMAYAGRRHKGKKVRIIVLRGQHERSTQS